MMLSDPSMMMNGMPGRGVVERGFDALLLHFCYCVLYQRAYCILNCLTSKSSRPLILVSTANNSTLTCSPLNLVCARVRDICTTKYCVLGMES